MKFLILGLLLSSCGQRDDAATLAAIPSVAAGMPKLFPADALRLRGPSELVLAEGRHGILLTLAEYNAAVEDYHFPADLDTVDARRQLLEKVIVHKTIAAEGRLRGYPVGDAATTREEERALVQQVVRQNMVLAAAIPDEVARQFVAEHPERFADLETTTSDGGPDLTHVKFVMRDTQFRAEVAEWRARENVVVHRERFDELLRGARIQDRSSSKDWSNP